LWRRPRYDILNRILLRTLGTGLLLKVNGLSPYLSYSSLYTFFKVEISRYDITGLLSHCLPELLVVKRDPRIFIGYN
jgi:hypothetical protein